MRTETLHTVSDPPTLEDLSFALYHMLTPPEQFAVRLRTNPRNGTLFRWFETLSIYDLRRIYVSWLSVHLDKLDPNIPLSCVKTFESILWGNRPAISIGSHRVRAGGKV